MTTEIKNIIPNLSTIHFLLLPQKLSIVFLKQPTSRPCATFPASLLLFSTMFCVELLLLLLMMLLLLRLMPLS
jgi:hypothetical protein